MAKEKVEKADFIEEEHLLYLDDLRDSGETNMHGAPAYVEQEFDVTEEESRVITQYWMDTFGKDER